MALACDGSSSSGAMYRTAAGSEVVMLFSPVPVGSVMDPVIPMFPRRASPSSVIRMFPWTDQELGDRYMST